MSDFLVGKFKSLEAAQSLKVGSKTVTNLIDSAAVTQIAPSGGIDSAVASGLIDSAFIAKNTNNLSEGENLYYTKGRSDSDFNANFNLSNSLLTADRLNEGQTNLFYTDDRVRVVSLDSAEAIQLIDSNYVQARQSTVGTGGLDSSSTIALIDSSHVQARQTSSGATVYSTMQQLVAATGMSQGDQALVTATNNLYIYAGSGWFKIATVQNNSPTPITGVDSNYTLAIDGTATTITAASTDPEGFPITFGFSTSGLGSIATVSQDSSVFTITPSTNTSNGGTFTLTITATDNVNGAVNFPSNFSLTFIVNVTNSRYTSLLLAADSAAGNLLITDASSNNQTITKSSNLNSLGMTGSASPYRHGGYSAYFDGGSDYANIASASNLHSAMDFGTDDYTVEFWMYPELSSNAFLFGFSNSSGTDNTVAFALRINMSGSDLLVRFQNCNDAGTLNLSLQATGDYNYKWSHVAITRTGGNQKMYINGSQVATQTDASAHMRTPSTSFSIGRAGDRSAFYYKGYISDLRIVNGTAIYTGNFTAPTEYLTAVTNTELLACRDAWYKDNSSNAWTITTPYSSGSNAETQPFTPYDSLEYNDSDYGGCIDFNTDTNKKTLTINDCKFYPRSDSWTCEMWVRFNSGYNTSTDHDIIDVYGSGGSSRWLFGTYNEKYRLFPAGANYSTVAPGLNKWDHLVLTHNGSNYQEKLFVNGKLEITATMGAEFHDQSLILNTGRPRYGPYMLADFKFTKGAILYSSNFTPPTSPVSSTFTTSNSQNFHLKGKFSSIFDKAQVSNLKLNGNTTGSTTQVKFANTKSIYFDGNGDYIDISSQPILDLDQTDFTVEAWVRLSSISGPQTLIAFALPHATFQISLTRNSSGNTYIMVGNSNSNSWASTNAIVSSNTLSANTWHHVAVTVERSTNTIVLYHDGTGVGSTTSSSHMPNYMAGNVRIGSYNHPSVSPGEFLNGYVQDLRVSRYVRYTTNFTVPSAPLEG